MIWLRKGRGITTFAACVVAFMVLVILEGAVVRATGSGAGCGNHWPLCNGEVRPHHPRLATMIEFTHRSLTGLCTALVAALIAWTFLSRPAGHRGRRAAVFTGLLLLTEGALGAVLVKGGYVEANASAARVFIQCIHFSNTMLLLAAMTLTWWWLGDRAPVASKSESHSIIWLALITTLITGATGSVAALADTLFPSTSISAAIAQDFSATAPLLIRMRWLHPATAVIAMVFAVWLCVRVRCKASRWLAILLGAQILLGVANVLLLAPTWLQVLHLLGADLFWIALVAIAGSLTTQSQAPQTSL